MLNKYQVDYANIDFLVPSMHCNAHGYRCKRLFHPDRNPIVGRVDGEACERCWADLSKVHSIVLNQNKCNRTLQLQDLLWNQLQRVADISIVEMLMRKYLRLQPSISQKRQEKSSCSEFFVQKLTLLLRISFFQQQYGREDEFKMEVRNMWMTEKTYFQSPVSTTSRSQLEKLDLKIKEYVCDINSTESCLVGHTFPSKPLFHLTTVRILKQCLVRGDIQGLSITEKNPGTQQEA
jgi:hypothetical protein